MFISVVLLAHAYIIYTYYTYNTIFLYVLHSTIVGRCFLCLLFLKHLYLCALIIYLNLSI